MDKEFMRKFYHTYYQDAAQVTVNSMPNPDKYRILSGQHEQLQDQFLRSLSASQQMAYQDVTDLLLEMNILENEAFYLKGAEDREKMLR